MTNELAGSEYHLNIGQILGEINVDELFAINGGNDTQQLQLSNILAIVSEIPGGDGTNRDSEKLPALIDCAVSKGCFANEEATLSAGFIDCFLFSGVLSRPPCHAEFDAVMETVNVVEVSKCFLEEDNGFEGQFEDIISPVGPFINTFDESAASLLINRRELITNENEFPGGSRNTSIPEEDKDKSLDLVLCLAGAILPPDAQREIMEIANDLFNIAGFVFDIIENGINIPGELILYFFGWGQYTETDGFVAPFKWYYCMFSVAIFLIAIENFKLVALRFIVWTKR